VPSGESDNGSAYISKAFAKACSALGLKQLRTRPYTPRTNGKTERYIQTLYREWAYSRPSQNSVGGNRCLSRYLSIYNRLRCVFSPGHSVARSRASC